MEYKKYPKIFIQMVIRLRFPYSIYFRITISPSPFGPSKPSKLCVDSRLTRPGKAISGSAAAPGVSDVLYIGGTKCGYMGIILLVLRREWMGMRVAGMITTSDDWDHSLIPC
jgi:hypothetical protein